MLEMLRTVLCGLGAVYLAVRLVRFLRAFGQIRPLSMTTGDQPVEAQTTERKRGRRARHVS